MAGSGEIRRPVGDVINFSIPDSVKVTVVWAANRPEFYVSRKVICSASDKLKDFAKPERTSVEFKWPMPTDFNLYMNWLYYRTIHIKAEEIEYWTITRLYMFGVFLKDAAFRDAMISCLMEKVEEAKANGKPCLPTVGCVEKAYTGYSQVAGTQNKSLQQALVDIFARDSKDKETLDAALGMGLPGRFLRDLSLKVVDFRGPDVVLLVGRPRACEFHEHKRGEECSVQGPSRKRRREE